MISLSRALGQTAKPTGFSRYATIRRSPSPDWGGSSRPSIPWSKATQPKVFALHCSVFRSVPLSLGLGFLGAVVENRSVTVGTGLLPMTRASAVTQESMRLHWTGGLEQLAEVILYPFVDDEPRHFGPVFDFETVTTDRLEDASVCAGGPQP